MPIRLLYLMFARICAWPVLLGRPTAPKDTAHPDGPWTTSSRQLHPPQPDHPPADLFQERIKRRAVLGGLTNTSAPNKSPAQRQ